MKRWSIETPHLSMPPQQAPQFFIGRKSPKDGWVTSLDQKEKDIGREQRKGRVKRHSTSK